MVTCTWTWQVEDAVSPDCVTTLQPWWQSEILSFKTKMQFMYGKQLTIVEWSYLYSWETLFSSQLSYISLCDLGQDLPWTFFHDRLSSTAGIGVHYRSFQFLNSMIWYFKNLLFGVIWAILYKWRWSYSSMLIEVPGWG